MKTGSASSSACDAVGLEIHSENRGHVTEERGSASLSVGILLPRQHAELNSLETSSQVSISCMVSNGVERDPSSPPTEKGNTGNQEES